MPTDTQQTRPDRVERARTAAEKRSDEMTEAKTRSEKGLSSDATELGARFLKDAVQSDAKSATDDADWIEQPIAGTSVQDDVVTDASPEADESVWVGNLDGSEPRAEDEEQRESADASALEVDMREAETRDASLLDREGEELDETVQAEPETSDERFHRSAHRRGR